MTQTRHENEHFSIDLPKGYIDATQYAFVHARRDEELVVEQLPNDPPTTPEAARDDLADRTAIIGSFQEEHRGREEIGSLVAHTFRCVVASDGEAMFMGLAVVGLDERSHLHMRYTADDSVKDARDRWEQVLGSLTPRGKPRAAAPPSREWSRRAAGGYELIVPADLMRSGGYLFHDPESEVSMEFGPLSDPESSRAAQSELQSEQRDPERFSIEGGSAMLKELDGGSADSQDAGSPAHDAEPVSIAIGLVESSRPPSWRVRVSCSPSSRSRALRDASAALRTLRLGSQP